MTIEEFLNATIPATQPNQFGVYVEDTPIEIANAKNKQLIVRCAYNGKEYMFGQSWWCETSGGGTPVTDRYSTLYPDKQSGLVEYLSHLKELRTYREFFGSEIDKAINSLKCIQMTLF